MAAELDAPTKLKRIVPLHPLRENSVSSDNKANFSEGRSGKLFLSEQALSRGDERVFQARLLRLFI